MALSVFLSKLRRRLARRLRMAAAFLVGAVYSWNTPGLALRKLWAALSGWIWHPTADSRRIYRRYRACRKCPLFYEPLRTCGTPMIEDLRQIGCWCNMEAKVTIHNAQCAIDENGLQDTGYGWSAKGID